MLQVTDPVLLKELVRQGINPADVDFDQDYAPRSRGKRHSPYAKFYRGLSGNARGKQWMVVSGLPMVDGDGVLCDPKWVRAGATYHTKSNIFDGLVNDIPGRVALTVKNDDAVGRKKNDRLVYQPQLFLNGIEVPRPNAVLLPVDPVNPNYLENTIEWDYGICKRRLRQIEGHIAGSWVFPANPNGEVRIKYNQTGQYRLRLGRYATDADTEVIPASAFITDEFGQPRQYPWAVSDSATYYPDANPETTSVDGACWEDGGNQTWAHVRDGPGDAADDVALYDNPVYITAGDNSNTWKYLVRCLYVIDTSGLPDAAVISAATFSLYGSAKSDTNSWIPNVNVYSSAPASNTALAAGDYDSLGVTAYCDTPITYAGWLIASPFWNDFVLNATGIAAISKTSVTKLGTRNVSYDVANSAPSWVAAANATLQGYMADKGAGYKPKLVVTYTVAVARGWMSK